MTVPRGHGRRSARAALDHDAPSDLPSDASSWRNNNERSPFPPFFAMGYKCQAMVQLFNPRLLVASLVLLVAAIGCAHPKPAPAPMVYRPAPPPPLPPPPPPKKVKLVVLPLDKLALPGTAEELNTKLAQVRLPGAEDAVLATVSMETAQLQSECAEATETCYLKIARLVDTDRLLWAQVEKVAGKGKKKAKKSGTRIQIVLFDRDKLSVSGQADETFAGSITGEELDKLIAAATGVRPGQAPEASPAAAAAPPPATMAPPAGRAAAAAPAPAARPVYAPQPAARQPLAPSATAPAPAGYQPQPGYQPPSSAAPPAGYQAPPAAAPSPPAYAAPAAEPPSAAPPPPAYAPPAAQPPPAAAPPPPAYSPSPAAPPSYAPPSAAPPSAPSPSPTRWQ